MSDDSTVQADDGAQEAKPEIDWKAKARDWERRAKENKSAADELAQIKEAQKTEAEKTAERVAKAEQTARDAEARALRREVALEHKLSADDLALLDGVTDETAMRRLAERLGADSSKTKSNHVPREGTTPAPGSSDERELARSLFAGD